MKEKRSRGVLALCLAVTVMVAVSAGAGVFLRGDGTTIATKSPRGETFRMVTSGIYRFNAERVVAEGAGWDFVTLFLTVPAMLVALPFLARGSVKAKLFVLGIMAYYFYQYLEYAMFWAFGPLFVLFILIYPSSAAAIVWIVSTIEVSDLPGSASDRFPRRSVATLNFVVAAVLILMWVKRIVDALGGRIEGALFGQTTMVVQALDLGFTVPLALFTGIMILRRRPVGYLLSTIFVVKAVAMATAISAMLLVAWSVEGSLETVPFLFFAVAALAFALIGARMYRSLNDGNRHARDIAPRAAAANDSDSVG